MEICTHTLHIHHTHQTYPIDNVNAGINGLTLDSKTQINVFLLAAYNDDRGVYIVTLQYQRDKDWDKLNAEQINASRTVQVIKLLVK